MSAAAVVLDVNETLFPLTPIRDRMAAAGLAPQRLEPWFRAVLVDGMAAAAADGPAHFPELARHHLEVELVEAGRAPDPDVVTGILAGFDEVVAHPDVLPALELLDRLQVEVALLTNGSASVVEAFVERSGLGGLIAAVWDVGEAGRWKPLSGALPVGRGSAGVAGRAGRHGRGTPLGRARCEGCGSGWWLARPVRSGALPTGLPPAGSGGAQPAGSRGAAHRLTSSRYSSAVRAAIAGQPKWSSTR